ncbi:MAG TPA: DUF6064 family protein [Gammaproteobacteria bacterium]|nr:DUF6064 family protein [Gammaproteobacteria bacterium]
MSLPFSQAQFFGVFAAYNGALWPVQLLFNLAAVFAVLSVLTWPRRSGTIVSAWLAVIWAWLAIAYHLAFFWAINPAAPLFAAISLAASLLFFWFGVVRRAIGFRPGMDARKVAGLLAVAFALVGYPLISLLLGHTWPAMPVFGLPCPATLYTFGMLLMAAKPLPRWVLLGPAAWAAIGAMAAFTLGVTQDLVLLAMLPVAGLLALPRR